MGGDGYIYFSEKSDKTGRIWSCNGDFAGSALDFAFADCEQSLQDELLQKDQTGIAKNECGTIPDRAIRVGFDGGMDSTAINIVRI